MSEGDYYVTKRDAERWLSRYLCATHVLYVFGSCERQSKLTEEMYIPLRPIPKEDSLRP